MCFCVSTLCIYNKNKEDKYPGVKEGSFSSIFGSSSGEKEREKEKEKPWT